eukprot:157306_1
MSKNKIACKLIYWLFMFCYLSVSGCPPEYIPCGTNGQEGDICSSSTNKIIAYGYNNLWAFQQKIGAVDIMCNDATFGDPDSSYAGLMECCKSVEDMIMDSVNF